MVVRKHDNHGGNIRVVTAPDGWPIWTSDVRPGRERDTTAARTHSQILPALTEAGTDLRTLGDLGYEGLSRSNPASRNCSGGASGTNAHAAAARSVKGSTGPAPSQSMNATGTPFR